MPIYEYRCSSCGHELEALQKFSDPPLAACPSCHADALVKLVSASGFHLKGSGWYATDFKGGGKPAAAKDTGEAKPDAKPESKSEPKTAGETGSKSEGASTVAAPASATGGTTAST
jgi:putative FmdB family regulatory protein